MSVTIGQQTVTSLDVTPASSGNIVITQESTNEDMASNSVEPAAIPYLIAALKQFLPKRKARPTR